MLLPLGRALRKHRIAVRTGPALAQFFPQFALEGRRNRVLQPLRLFVNLVPLHAEDLAQHALDQVVPQRRPVSRLSSRRRQAHNPVRAHLHKTIPLQPLQRHGHRGGRNLKPVRQHRRNHLVPLGLSLQNGLQVILFRYVNRVFHRGTLQSVYRTLTRRAGYKAGPMQARNPSLADEIALSYACKTFVSCP